MTSDIRDRCCWRSPRCLAESDLIYYGVGLCDEHWTMACSVYLDTLTFILPRVIPEAAEMIRAQDERNKAKRNKAERESGLKA